MDLADEALWEDEDEDDDFNASEEGSSEEEEEEKPKKGKKGAAKKDTKAAKKPKKQDKRRRKPADDDEEEEDEDDDDSEEGGGARKRRRRGAGAQFIDEMAAVDDEDEEEEAEDDMEELINDKDEELGPEDLEAGQAAAAYRAVNRQADDRTEEELAKYIEERYKDMEEDEFEAEAYDGDALSQETLLPTTNDPRLWVVQCRGGREREAVMQLLQKAYTMEERGAPLAIRSAVCHDHLKGYFYVEADKANHVLEAIKGLRTMFVSKGAKMVPLKEMPDAIAVPRSSRGMEVVRDSWVRVKNGLYKDDLAKVLDVDYATSKAVVQIVPRLDLKAIKARQDGTGDGGGRGNFGRALVVRPAPRAFSQAEARAQGLQVLQDKYEQGVVVLNSHRFKGGYTLRSMALKSLIRVEAPPMDELAAYQAASGGGGRGGDDVDPMAEIAAALPDAAARRAVFVPGDKVVVISGDLVNLEGVVTKVDDGDGGQVHIRSIGGDGVDEVELPLAPSEIVKAFRVGDHVRVLSGSHKGETGIVVKVERGVCAVVGDATRSQFRVNARDLAEGSDEAPGLEVLGDKYQLHDLVQLDANTAGVIVSVERGAARVLTNHGTAAAPDVRVCKVADITRKLANTRATTVDRHGANISVSEAVEVVDGELKGKKGTVHAVVRGQVFLRLADAPDKSLGGFVCVRNRSCATKASSAAAATGPAGAPQPPQQPDRGAPPGGFSGRGGGGFGGGGRGRGRGAGGGMAGLELKVQGGPYSGYKGRVLQETPTHVRLELDAINRIVTVERRYVMPGMQQASGAGRGFVPGGVGRGYPGPGMGRGFAGPSGEPPAPGAVPRTPMHPMQTPLHPSMTPRHPSQLGTPMHPGLSTPAHPSFGMRTPAHPSMGGGEDLGYGGYGGGGGGGGGDYRGYAAPTPGSGGYGGGGGYQPAQTPGTAETPGGFDLAATPGVAATPGLDAGYAPAPTPGGHGLAPTPGPGAAATPAGGDGWYAAPTPGGLGGPGGGGPVATPGGPGGGGPAYTPGYGYGATPGGLVAATPGGPGGEGGGGPLAGEPAPPGGGGGGDDLPDYAGVLLQLEGGAVGVGLGWGPGPALEAAPLGGGAAVVVDVIELVKPQRQDLVKVVSGPTKGTTGRLISIEGSDAVLLDGTLAELSCIGKLADQSGGGGGGGA
ncbi:MAG: hypothetical protein J3K34DRAFT_519351 [Monoraphidium minutum]|nr:MAG: hypothetical protein J3K34DRAFT_519351 [Monoraphidium minutum]